MTAHPNRIDIGEADDSPATVDVTAVLGPFFTGESEAKRPVASHTFVIANPSAKEIHLAVASQSCGCTSVHLGDGRVPAGGTLGVRVEIVLPNVSRREVQTVVLRSSSGHPRDISLTLDCYPYSRLGIFPLDPARVRVTAKEPTVVSTKVALYQPEAELPAEPIARCRGEGLSVRLDNIRSRSMGGGVREITADLVTTIALADDRNAHTGVREGVVTVSVADGEAASRKIVWSPELPIRSIPERLLVQPAKTSARSSVRLRSKQRFKVSRVEADVPWLTAEIKGGPEACEQVIELATKPLALPSAARGVVTAYCEHPAQSVVHIPVVGLASPFEPSAQ